MDEITPFDKAQLRHEFRQLLKDRGVEVGPQVLYELLISANILCEVILEENKKNLESQ